jgi:hypothetical protein
MNRAACRRSTAVLAWVACLLVQGTARGNDCWLDVYENNDFKGAHLRIEGPVEAPDLRDFKGQNWSNRIDSLIVGPKAQVWAYTDINFEDTRDAPVNHPDALKAWGETERNYTEKEITFGPGKKEHHLGELLFHHNINSLKIQCLP